MYFGKINIDTFFKVNNSSLQRPKLGLSGSAGVDIESNGINIILLEIDKNLNHDDKNKTKK